MARKMKRFKGEISPFNNCGIKYMIRVIEEAVMHIAEDPCYASCDDERDYIIIKNKDIGFVMWLFNPINQIFAKLLYKNYDD